MTRTIRTRLAALITALALVLPAAPGLTAAAATFDDVAGDSWYCSAVDYVSGKGIFKGTGAGTFSPDGTMTRGMYITALGRMANVDPDGITDPNPFPDVADGAYYTPYIIWAFAERIDMGSSIGFHPDEPVTREDMAVILSRYCDSAGITLEAKAEPISFADEDDFGPYNIDTVEALQAAGVINGVAAGNGVMFYPQRQSTRAEAAALLMRFDMAVSGGVDGADTARELVQLFIDGKYEESKALMAQTLIDELEGMGGIDSFLQYMTSQYGALIKITGVSFLGTQGAYEVYLVSVETASGSVSFQIVLDAEGKVAGIQGLPGAEDPIAMPGGFVEEEVIVDAGTGYPLEGRLVRPESTAKPVPLVVLVQGSGATDYDEIVGVNRVFGKLAKGLAEQGIATLRYDKRNYAYPEISLRNDYSINEEYVEDVIAAVALAKTFDGIDPDNIFILGHSQGGMLAPLLIDSGAQAKGMILFAGSPRSLMDILDDQQELVIAYYAALGMDDIITQYRAMQEEWRAQRAALEGMTAQEAKNAGTVYEMNAYYMYVLNQNDAIGTIRKLKVPTLIMQGTNDWQVYADKDYKIYEDEVGGEEYVTMKLYDGLSHIFTPSSATNMVDAMAEYNHKADIPGEVFSDIAAWVAANK